MPPSSAMHVDGPTIRTKLPGPNARRIIAEDQRLISPSYTRSYPMVAKRGHGAIVEDVDGNEFLDFSAGIAVTSTGHCHPEVVAAIQKQAAELLHMSGTDFYYPQLTELAARLSKIAPMPGPHRVHYGNSGAEAVEAALKLARYHTKRQYVIAFYGAFHGRTMGALSLTCSKAQQRRRFAPLVPGVVHVPYPNLYRRPAGSDAEQYARDTARHIEDWVFRTEVPPEECAAIVVEPFQGEGGYLPAPTVFLQELRRICDKHGILLVVDEVQSGMGRTGQWWAIEHSGVEPDIVCTAKGIASGMPLSAIITRASVMDWVPGSHASTFGGNPVAIAAAMATLDIIEREGLRNAREVGEHIMDRISEWPERLPLVGDVRGRGLMIGIEFVADKKTKAPSAEARDHVVDLAFERGVLVLGCGPNTLRLSPPLIVTKQQADIALDTIEECIKLVGAGNYKLPNWGE
ncbi:MAG: acetyl ornithine aminotransferase family protein [Acidobacteriota bacterium]|nr:acetyl ornithine aminotransferase family protein [Acidobacteriota bacterium]